MRKIIRNLDKPLLIITILLFVIGLVMVFSASNVTAYMSHAVSPYNYFLKQGLFLLVGLVLAVIIVSFSVRDYSILSKILMFLGIAALALLPFFGEERNQAVSWYNLKYFTFQPSEFLKVITIVWLANYYDQNIKKNDNEMHSLFPLAICGIVFALIFIQPDLGTAIIYVAIVFCIFWISPIKKMIIYKTFLIVVGLIILAGLAVFGVGGKLILSRQLERITEYRNPCDKLLSSGNQVCNSYIAINNGGLTGVGLGNSTQKYLYLPEPYTDFIYAIIVEELGLIFGVGLILAYVFILYRILKIGRESYTNAGAMICFGVAAYIAIHIVVNLMGLFGLIPMTGVPLPFMSYGGSFTICLIAALTIVQRVNVENNLQKEEIAQKTR